VDLVHFDYAAAAQSRAATVGGISTALWPSISGRWNQTGVPLSELKPDVYGAGMCVRTTVPNSGDRECKPPAGIPWRLPYDLSPVVGPIAMYRGTVGSRLVPAPVEVSLPPVLGGRWDCNSTALAGAFIGR